MTFDQVFYISSDPDSRQPMNRLIVTKFKDSVSGDELTDSFSTNSLGKDPLDSESIITMFKDVLRKRMKSLNESRALVDALATLDKNIPLDLSLSADDEATRITLDANNAYNAALQAKLHIDMLVEHEIVSVDDPEIKEKTEQAMVAREALKVLTVEGADAIAVKK